MRIHYIYKELGKKGKGKWETVNSITVSSNRDKQIGQ